MTGDVVDMLMDDHREVERLLGILQHSPEQRPLMVPVVAALLTAHDRAEEAEVYPAARTEAGEEEETEHSSEEHGQAEKLLENLRTVSDTSSKKFDEQLQQFVDAVNHHVQDEENSVLPGIRERLSDDRRQDLGRAFAARRAAELVPSGSGGKVTDKSKGELYEQAKQAGVSGRSSMSKDELAEHLESS